MDPKELLKKCKLYYRKWKSPDAYILRLFMKFSSYLKLFQDFENLYKSPMHRNQGPPAPLIDKIVQRTDKWLVSIHKQLKEDSLIFVLGNHGRMGGQQQYSPAAAIRRGNDLPVGMIIRK